MDRLREYIIRKKGQSPKHGKMISRVALSISRWTSCLAAVVLGAVVVASVRSRMEGFPLPVCLHGRSWPLVPLAFTFLLGAVLWLLPPLRTTLSLKGGRMSLWFPKIGHLAVLFGPIVTVQCCRLLDFLATSKWAGSGGTGDWSLLDVLMPSLALMGGVLAMDGVSWVVRRVRKDFCSADQPNPESEAPLHDLHYDILDIPPLCDDIAAALVRGDDVALIGEFGSGKSTVALHVAERVYGVPGAAFAAASTWGLNGRAKVEQIIEAILNAMDGAGVDLLSVQGIPTAYAQAVGAVHSKLGDLVEVICGLSVPPWSLLPRIDYVLRVVGLHVVVCIEDIERDVSDKDVDFLNGLLSEVAGLSQVSLLVTYVANKDTIHNEVIRERLCNVVRTMPSIPPEKAWDKVCKLHRNCFDFGKEHGDIIFENDAGGLWIPLRSTAAWALSPEIRGMMESIANVLRTPRMLKATLRQVRDVWQGGLHGEVDFLELLILTIVRTRSPKLFDHLDAHRSYYFGKSHALEVGSEAARDEIVENARELQIPPSLKKLVWPMAGALVEDRDVDDLVTEGMARIGVSQFLSIHHLRRGSMVWRRLQERRVPGDQVVIQPYLRDANTWLTDAPEKLVAKVQNDANMPRVFGQWGYLLPNRHRLPEFFNSLMRAYVGRSSRRGDGSAVCEGWGDVSGLLMRIDNRRATVQQIVDLVIPESFAVAERLLAESAQEDAGLADMMLRKTKETLMHADDALLRLSQTNQETVLAFFLLRALDVGTTNSAKNMCREIVALIVRSAPRCLDAATRVLARLFLAFQRVPEGEQVHPGVEYQQLTVNIPVVQALLNGEHRDEVLAIWAAWLREYPSSDSTLATAVQEFLGSPGLQEEWKRVSVVGRKNRDVHGIGTKDTALPTDSAEMTP